MIEKLLPKILFLLFLIWLVVLLGRSGLYVKRIFFETKQYFSTPADHPSKTHFQEIKPCSPEPNPSKEEEFHLWGYRNLGVKCKR